MSGKKLVGHAAADRTEAYRGEPSPAFLHHPDVHVSDRAAGGYFKGRGDHKEIRWAVYDYSRVLSLLDETGWHKIMHGALSMRQFTKKWGSSVPMLWIGEEAPSANLLSRPSRVKVEQV